jgi:aspartate aminotransferase
MQLSARATATADAIATVFDFFSTYRAGIDDARVRADLTFGNPNEMPLPALVAALKARMEPQAPSWFAYKTSEEEPCRIIATALQAELDLPFHPDDIIMTQGAFGAIGLAFSLLLDPGDECCARATPCRSRCPWPRAPSTSTSPPSRPRSPRAPGSSS